MWWLRRSITTTSASHRFKARAVATPANPPPTITMRLRPASGASDRASRLLECHGGRFVPGAQLEQSQQDLVTLRLQVGDRARSHLRMQAVDQLAPHFRRQFERAEHLPPGRHRPGELVEEVLDAALPATQGIEKDLTHDAPAQSGSPGHRPVDIAATD